MLSLLLFFAKSMKCRFERCNYFTMTYIHFDKLKKKVYY